MSAVPVVAGFPRVNLMPRSEVARRERDKLARMWVWIVLGAVVVAALIVLGAFAFKLLADQRLAAEQARTNVLLAEIASLAEVSGAIATQSELTEFRSEAMSTDVVWPPVIGKITSVLPADTTLIGFDFVVGGTPQGEDLALEAGLVGTVSIESPTPLDIVEIIRSLRGVEGVLSADGQSVTESAVNEGRYAYQLNVQFDQTVYSTEYAPIEEGTE